jgi:hypothetical protein
MKERRILDDMQIIADSGISVTKGSLRIYTPSSEHSPGSQKRLWVEAKMQEPTSGLSNQWVNTRVVGESP